MSKGVNMAIIVGNLGDNPQVNTTTTGAKVANISVATSESWIDKNTQQKVEQTEWHRVVFFNRLAEIVEQYLTKGSQVYIEGRLRTRKWQDQNGQDKYTTEIVAKEMQMLGGRGGNQADGGNQNTGQNQPAAAAANQRAPAMAAAGGGGGGAEADIFSDDIPFESSDKRFMSY